MVTNHRIGIILENRPTPPIDFAGSGDKGLMTLVRDKLSGLIRPQLSS
ncbi:hypothetical protein [Roseiconus lacunae]|nr:hypothetical protein [Roseiconus lacunae]